MNNIESYIKSFTDKDIYPYDPDWYGEEDYPKDIIIFDCNQEGFQNYWYNHAIQCLKHSGALFILGGTPLVYQLVKLRFPVLINEDRSFSVLLPYFDRQDYHLDVSRIKKMRPENYWSYLELWNKQGNRNIIPPQRFMDNILWNRFNPQNIKFL